MNKTNAVKAGHSRTPDAHDIHEVRGAVYLVFIILLGVVGFLVWALNSEIDEIARARGEVIAAARTQVVQVTDGGKLESLFVEEGDTVRKGKVLARLDATRAVGLYRESEAKVALLDAMRTRLKAELFGDEMVFPELLDGYPEFVREQTLLYNHRRKSFEDETKALRGKLAAINRELGVANLLLKNGAIGSNEVLRLRSERADVQVRLTEVSANFLDKAQNSLASVEERPGK